MLACRGPAEACVASMTLDAPEPPLPAKQSGHHWLDLLVSIATACCNGEFAPFTRVPHPWDQIGDLITSPLGPSVLAASDRFDALRWQRNSSNAALWDAIDRVRQRDGLAVHTGYCSVFNECWPAETNTLPQQLPGLCRARR